MKGGDLQALPIKDNLVLGQCTLGFEFGRSHLVVAMPFRPVAVVAVAAAAYTAVVAERELDLHMRKKEDLIRTAVAAVVVAVVAAADFVFHNR